MAKKTEFEKYLEDNTLILGRNLKKAELSPLDFKFKRTKELKGGMHSYVTKVWDGDKAWAVKEGRTDMTLPLFKDFEIPLDRNFWSMVLSPLGYDIMPEVEKVAKELREYFLVAKYLGYFEEDYKVLGDNEFLREEQRKLRKELKNFYTGTGQLSSLVRRLTNNDQIKMKLLRKALSQDDVVNYNFLVKEYVIIAKPKKAKYKETFYIVQEWVDGYTLVNSIEEDFTQKMCARLLVFIILSLFLFEEEQKLIDTRGVEALTANWFADTANVIINPHMEGMKFIDTRSLWDVTGNFIEKGIFSADMLLHSFIQSFDEYLDKYAKTLTKKD